MLPLLLVIKCVLFIIIIILVDSNTCRYENIYYGTRKMVAVRFSFTNKG